MGHYFFESTKNPDFSGPFFNKIPSFHAGIVQAYNLLFDSKYNMTIMKNDDHENDSCFKNNQKKCKFSEFKLEYLKIPFRIGIYYIFYYRSYP